MLPVIPEPSLNSPAKTAGVVSTGESGTDFATMLATETMVQVPRLPIPALPETQDLQQGAQTDRSEQSGASPTAPGAVPPTPPLPATDHNNRTAPLGVQGPTSTSATHQQGFIGSMAAAVLNDSQTPRPDPEPDTFSGVHNRTTDGPLSPATAPDNNGTTPLADPGQTTTATHQQGFIGNMAAAALDETRTSRPVPGPDALNKGPIVITLLADRGQGGPMLPGKTSNWLLSSIATPPPPAETPSRLRNPLDAKFIQNAASAFNPPGPPSPVYQLHTVANTESSQPGLFDLASHSTGEELPPPVPQEFSTGLPVAGTPLAGGVRPPLDAAPLLQHPSPIVNLSDRQIIDQVVSRVTLSRSSGETNLSLTLHPQDLGDVRIELVSDKDGLRAHLHSQNQLVQDALEKHLPRLREAFESQGLKIQDLQVSCDTRRDGGTDSQHDQGLPYRFQTRFLSGGATDGEERDQPVEALLAASGWSNAQGFSLRI